MLFPFCFPHGLLHFDTDQVLFHHWVGISAEGTIMTIWQLNNAQRAKLYQVLITIWLLTQGHNLFTKITFFNYGAAGPEKQF